jgi:hypothetical protein
MAKSLKFPPFPKLTWEEVDWQGTSKLPWYNTEEPPALIVRTEGLKPTNPTPAQVAAYQSLLQSGVQLQPIILEQFRQYVPELAHAKWPELEAFFQLTAIFIFDLERDDVSYVGLVFSCLQWDYGYEHGVGIVLHDQRVVRFGVAEMAECETEAAKDLGLLPPDEDEEE